MKLSYMRGIYTIGAPTGATTYTDWYEQIDAAAAAAAGAGEAAGGSAGAGAAGAKWRLPSPSRSRRQQRQGPRLIHVNYLL